MTLSFQDVFTPAPSGVGRNPPPGDSWLGRILTNATTLQLAVTAWQSGGIGRTILAIAANMLMLGDVNTSLMAQGGFLDFAASGTVTYVDPNTGATIVRYVTPDPTDPSTWPTPGTVPGPGWLDILADSTYNETRLGAVRAPGNLSITNAQGVSYGPFSPGTYHVASPTTKQTYSNVNALTIGALTTTTALFHADLAGADGSAAPGSVTASLTSLVGVTVTNATAWVGSDGDSNTKLVTKCRLKIQALSTNGPKGAYQYWAIKTYEALTQSDGTSLLSKPIDGATVALDTLTGIVMTTIGYQPNGVALDGTPVVHGRTGLFVSGASNATPIVLTLSSTSGITPGDIAFVNGVKGNTAANGYFIAGTIVGSTVQLKNLDGSDTTGNGTYTNGGVVGTGDLGLVDSVIQANAVPLAVTALTQSALAQNVTVAATVWVPAAQAATVAATLINAISVYLTTKVPIGGFVDGVETPNTVPIDGVLGAMFAAAPYMRDAAVLLNGVAADLAVGAQNVVVPGIPAITVKPF